MPQKRDFRYSVAEVLSILEDDDFQSADCFILPPEDPTRSDEDSGPEDGDVNNLTGNQLRAQAEATVTVSRLHRVHNGEYDEGFFPNSLNHVAEEELAAQAKRRRKRRSSPVGSDEPTAVEVAALPVKQGRTRKPVMPRRKAEATSVNNGKPADTEVAAPAPNLGRKPRTGLVEEVVAPVSKHIGAPSASSQQDNKLSVLQERKARTKSIPPQRQWVKRDLR